MTSERSESRRIDDSSSSQGSTASLAGIARAANNIGRILLCLAIAAAVVLSLLIVQDMRSTDSPPTAVPAISLGSNSMEDALNGNWQFAGSPWSVRVQELASAELPVLLRQVPNTSSFVTEADAPEFDEAGTLVLAVLGMLGAAETAEGECVVYRAQSDGLECIAWAPRSDSKKIQIARIAQRINDSAWNMIEIGRRPQSESLGDGNLLPLLPEAAENVRLAMRFDAKGQLCAQLIQLNIDFDRLQSTWTKAGWERNQYGHEAIVGYQASMEEPIVFTRGLETILAIAPPAAGDVPRTLLLIRAP